MSVTVLKKNRPGLRQKGYKEQEEKKKYITGKAGAEIKEGRMKMAAGRGTSTHYPEYIHGNTARVIEPVRKEKKHQQKPVRRKVVSYTVWRNQEKALHMNLPYVILFTVAAFCVLAICVNYLQIQSTISARLAHIEQLEKSVEQMKAENDATETRINTSVDLDYIYKVATEELGMVYANRNQVLLYDKTESEYVRQYEDIPKQ